MMTNNRKWEIIFLASALRDLKKLDKPIQKKIYAFLKDHVRNLEDPRDLGKPLKGNFKGLWRYRVAQQYRVICEIKDRDLIISVIKVDHRKKVYKSH